MGKRIELRGGVQWRAAGAGARDRAVGRLARGDRRSGGRPERRRGRRRRRAIDEVERTLRVDVVGEGERRSAVPALDVDVRIAAVVAMLVQRAGMHVRRGAVGVVVGDERRLRDDPAGEEARQDHYRQARSRPHRRVAASMALAHSTTLFTVRQADADVRRSTPGPGVVEEASMWALVFRPSGPLW